MRRAERASQQNTVGRRKLRAEHVPGQRNVVRAEGVDAQCCETFHLFGIVHGPRHNTTAASLGLSHEILIDEWPLPPQVAAADGVQRVQPVYGVADFEHTARELWGETACLGNLAVVERVDGAADASGGERLDRALGASGTFELSVGRQPEFPVQRKCFGERGNLLGRWGSEWQRVVVHADDAVRVKVQIKLTAVCAQFGGPAKGCEAVLWTLAGSAAVGDELGAGHDGSLTSVSPRRLTLRVCL